MPFSRPIAWPSKLHRQPPFAPGAAPIYLFIIMAWGLMPGLLAMTGLHIALDEFGMLGFILAIMLWFAWCLRGRGLVRIATALEAWTLFSTICTTLCLITFVAGTSHRAYFDASLAQADRIILPGFDWPRVMRSFWRSGQPVQVANWIYGSIRWQPQLLVVMLALMAAHQRIWHFLLSWITTLCIIVVISTLYPALGAYPHFGIAAAIVPGMLDPAPWHTPALVEGLRNGTLRFISLGTLSGIVTFPSFHAGAAVLLAYRFWSIRIVRWPFLALNTLMLISAVPIGGHYVVDLFVGIITAIAGIAATNWIIGRTSKLSAVSRLTFVPSAATTDRI